MILFHPYGLMIGLGVIVGIWVAQKQAKHFGIMSKLIDDSLFWIVIPAILGARIYHVVTDWHLYAGGPYLNILAIWNGGLGFFGALLGGILGLIAFASFVPFKKFSIFNFQFSKFFLLLDLLSFGAPLAQAIGRFGNYFNQELYGLPTTLPWGILIGGQKYHPLFAYEALFNFFVFLGLNWLGWKKKFVLGKGQYACLYVASYGLIRFWLEFLRIDTARWSEPLGIFSIAQWVAIGITIIAIVVFWIRRHAPRKAWDWSLE